jgi:UDP-3-O-[3-hydroxymyristoyl] glucosamine N-acyltransferase
LANETGVSFIVRFARTGRGVVATAGGAGDEANVVKAEDESPGMVVAVVVLSAAVVGAAVVVGAAEVVGGGGVVGHVVVLEAAVVVFPLVGDVALEANNDVAFAGAFVPLGGFEALYT